MPLHILKSNMYHIYKNKCIPDLVMARVIPINYYVEVNARIKSMLMQYQAAVQKSWCRPLMSKPKAILARKIKLPGTAYGRNF